MKPVRVLSFIFLMVAWLAPAQTTVPSGRKAVVVELFTSEGCSSCPPADALLGSLRDERFAPGVDVLPLGMHVDYWNHLGWTDRFSSNAYSRRQAKYAEIFRIDGPYTPQMVVDGVSQFTGSDAQRARQAIAQAALRAPTAEIEITRAPKQSLHIEVKAAPGTAADVILAITEDNLSSKVEAGENSHRELHHSAVVRELKLLGHLVNGRFDAGIPLKLRTDWKQNDLRVVVFVQRESGGPIAGAASIQLADQSANAAKRN